MKKTVLTVLSIMLITALSGCAGSAAPAATSSGMTLDQAIKEAAGQIDRRFEANSKIALVNFNSTSDQFSAYVLDELTANLVDSRHLEVIDRQEIELRRGELNLQMSGEVSDASMQALGQTLGAQNIVSGSLTSIGNTYRIVIRALNVESGRVEVQYRQDIANDSRVAALLGGSRSGGTATAGGGSSSGGQAAAQDTGPTYKIGDTGPAGGIIFYDKGNRTGGWRYLEAAPEDIERRLKLSLDEHSVNYDNFREQGIGWGKRNTEAFLKEPNVNFGWAAKVVDELEINGFNDWFIPSADELNFIYGNLHLRGLGNFRNEHYWSSSANDTISNFRALVFSDGSFQNWYVEMEYRIRPIRQF